VRKINEKLSIDTTVINDPRPRDDPLYYTRGPHPEEYPMKLRFDNRASTVGSTNEDQSVIIRPPPKENEMFDIISEEFESGSSGEEEIKKDFNIVQLPPAKVKEIHIKDTDNIFQKFMNDTDTMKLVDSVKEETIKNFEAMPKQEIKPFLLKAEKLAKQYIEEGKEGYKLSVVKENFDAFMMFLLNILVVESILDSELLKLIIHSYIAVAF